MRRLAALLVATLSLAATAGEPAFDPAQAAAVLRVNDVRWLEREVVRISTAQGRDPAPLRQSIATALFRCASMEGIDTSRPALLAWRNGPSPLLAIIPVSNRRRFVDDFGAMPAGEPPLVRVGDRDGAVILSQNHPSGVREYRLLVVSNTAYLARTLDECRALAARPPAASIDPQVSVSLWSRGAWSGSDMGLGSLLDLPAMAPTASWQDSAPVLSALQQTATDQIESWQWDFRPAGEGELRMSLRATAKADSPLAQWISGQRNLASRLAGPMRSDSTALLLWGNLAWQGQLAPFAAAQAPALRARLGPAWIPAVDEAWSTWWSLWERAGDTAWALEVPEAGRHQTIVAVEQPRAVEHAAAWDVVAGALTGIPGTGTGQLRQRQGRIGTTGFAQAVAAIDRHTLVVECFGGQATADGAAEIVKRTAARITQSAAIEGEGAIAQLWCDLARLARHSPAISPDAQLPPAVITAILRQTAPNQITLDASLPLRAIAAVVGQCQPAGKRRPASR